MFFKQLKMWRASKEWVHDIRANLLKKLCWYPEQLPWVPQDRLFVSFLGILGGPGQSWSLFWKKNSQVLKKEKNLYGHKSEKISNLDMKIVIKWRFHDKKEQP